MSWHGPRKGQRWPLHDRKRRHVRRETVAETLEDWKAVAVERCRIVVEEFDYDYVKEAEALTARVDAWENAEGLATAEGWAVYRHLGLLRDTSGEELFRDPERLILTLLASQDYGAA